MFFVGHAQLLRSEVNGVETLHSMLVEDIGLISDPDVRAPPPFLFFVAVFQGFSHICEGIFFRRRWGNMCMVVLVLCPIQSTIGTVNRFSQLRLLGNGLSRGLREITSPNTPIPFPALMSNHPVRCPRQSDRAAHRARAALAGIQADIQLGRHGPHPRHQVQEGHAPVQRRGEEARAAEARDKRRPPPGGQARRRR